jgi:hypothetical protein
LFVVVTGGYVKKIYAFAAVLAVFVSTSAAAETLTIDAIKSLIAAGLG